MSTTNRSRLTSLNSDVLAIVSAVFICSGLLVLAFHDSTYFQFRPNAYVLLSALQVIISCALLVALYIRKGNFHARLWFAVVIVGFILLGSSEILDRLSKSPSQALLWANLGFFGLACIPVGFYMFAFYFTGAKAQHRDAVIPAILIASAGVFITLVTGQNELQFVAQTQGPWGYALPISALTVVFIIWLGLIVCLGIYRIIRYSQSDVDPDAKAQAKIIILGAGIALAGGVGLDILPRYLGLHVLPIGILFQTILPAGVIYAIYKYDTFAIDFSTLASDVFDVMAEGIIITDFDYNVRMANRYALELSGYSNQVLCKSSIRQLFKPESFEGMMSSAKPTLRNNKIAVVNDTTIMSQLGATKAVNVSIYRLGGTIAGYLFAFTDIRELKRYDDLEQKRTTELETANENFRNQQQAMLNLLEDSRDLSRQIQEEKAGVEEKVAQRTAEVRAERARLEASINSLNIGFIIVDKDMQILTANAAFRTIVDDQTNQNNPEIQRLAMLLGDSFDIMASIKTCLQSGENVTQDNLQIGERMIRIFIAPIFGDDAKQDSLGAVVLAEDITEAKAVERSRDEFFSIASHELRTPLTAIRGNTSMMMDFYKEELSDPSLKEMVDDIHDSSIRLITIVNDFLDTSRLEQGKISFQITDFDVKDLVEEVIQEFKAGEVNPKLYIKLIVESTALPKAHADRDRLKQTIINLVGNGFKFTDTGGVTIHLSDSNGTLTIEVTDTGKGIPVESRNLLFRKFQQASNNILTRDSTRSTGLGLYISKLIIEGMKGKIYMSKSEVGVGSTFVVEIPAAS